MTIGDITIGEMINNLRDKDYTKIDIRYDNNLQLFECRASSPILNKFKDTIIKEWQPNEKGFTVFIGD